MHYLTSRACGIALLALTLSSQAFAAEKSLGQAEYERSCVSCHGATGDSEGPFAKMLKAKVPKLNTLSKRNGGVFPFDRTFKIIDGRIPVPGHGEGDMPIWGDVFTTESIDEYGPNFGEFFEQDYIVRARILALIDYINQLQR